MHELGSLGGVTRVSGLLAVNTQEPTRDGATQDRYGGRACHHRDPCKPSSALGFLMAIND